MHGLIVQSLVSFYYFGCGNTSVQVKALLVSLIRKVDLTKPKQAWRLLEFHFQGRRICGITISPGTFRCQAALRRLKTRKGATGEAKSFFSPFAIKA